MSLGLYVLTQDFSGAVPRLLGTVPRLSGAVPRLPCPKSACPKTACPKTTVPRLPVPRLLSQDYCPKTACPKTACPKSTVPRLPVPRLPVPRLPVPRPDLGLCILAFRHLFIIIFNPKAYNCRFVRFQPYPPTQDYRRFFLICHYQIYRFNYVLRVRVLNPEHGIV